jgi:endonuclease/exonuclease/phosphatase family metal-dependent hydrolase
MDRESAHLQIVTWNVRHGSPTHEVVSAVLGMFERPIDALCLQEVVLWSLTPPRRNLQRALARATGMRGALAAHPRRYACWAEGVSVLTPHAILASTRTRLSARRALLRARIATPLGEIELGSIHLSRPELRAGELAAAAACMPARRGILAGDFNLPLSSIAAIGTGLEPYRPDGCDPTGVDRVFVSSDLVVVRCQPLARSVSDHAPLLASIAPYSA